ncbi:hypothetical protein HBH92_041920 [Parastagonospora nodorum]|nr:hypothetical protein HBH92_041920 [Parastagonospora nodorum]KAH4458624.1 hypothetical protein HBH91_078590 [Parastagonospora nodorum]KAH4513254.1 hypothetical protein HBH89_040650 [Parastagonospora nodorum]KAH4550655.1 hypothetical protein HBH85_044210 [Parastagonospora nodorum]KAH4572324.1 hypothetical protein HBH86_027130 [Parastagonospora nodorum]
MVASTYSESKPTWQGTHPVCFWVKLEQIAIRFHIANPVCRYLFRCNLWNAHLIWLIFLDETMPRITMLTATILLIVVEVAPNHDGSQLRTCAMRIHEFKDSPSEIFHLDAGLCMFLFRLWQT